MFKGSQEPFISIVSEQNNFYKKMIKFNEYWMHFVNLSFESSLGLHKETNSLCNPRLDFFLSPLIFCHLITKIYIFMDLKFQ